MPKEQLLAVFYASLMDDITLLSIIFIMTFRAVIFMHRHITTFFATSHIPVSGAWSMGSCTGKSEITVGVPVL